MKKLTTKFTALLSILTLVFLAGLSTEQSPAFAVAAPKNKSSENIG